MIIMPQLSNEQGIETPNPNTAEWLYIYFIKARKGSS